MWEGGRAAPQAEEAALAGQWAPTRAHGRAKYQPGGRPWGEARASRERRSGQARPGQAGQVGQRGCWAITIKAGRAVTPAVAARTQPRPRPAISRQRRRSVARQVFLRGRRPWDSRARPANPGLDCRQWPLAGRRRRALRCAALMIIISIGKKQGACGTTRNATQRKATQRNAGKKALGGQSKPGVLCSLALCLALLCGQTPTRRSATRPASRQGWRQQTGHDHAQRPAARSATCWRWPPSPAFGESAPPAGPVPCGPPASLSRSPWSADGRP